MHHGNHRLLHTCTLGMHSCTDFLEHRPTKLSDILSCRVPLTPSLCLLGLTTAISIPPRHKNSLLTSLTIAKKTILQNWKSKQVININQWSNLLYQFITSSLTVACYDDDITPFINSWEPFINHYSIDQKHFTTSTVT